MSSKAFLLEECENVRDLLEKTLRHEYGLDSSHHFFDECSTRLRFLTNEIASADPANTALLQSHGAFLSDLAELICRIERSSLGEYSWPFVHELKKIASAICRENTLTDPDAAPHVYVFAEGGLSAYAIYPELRRPSAAKQRLLTIVFPKSLKNFVLLHPILGHELGHAIWQCSKHQKTLVNDVLRHLRRTGSNLEHPAATAAHLFAANAPAAFKAALAKHPSLTQASMFTHANWGAWIEEILCDLIGLVTFGPSFLAAHARLLFSVDPTGMSFSSRHPPVAWRFNMIRTCASILGYDVQPPATSPIRAMSDSFWAYMGTFKQADAWYDFLDLALLTDAINGVQALLGAHAPSAYVPPAFDILETLAGKLTNLVPPVGNGIGVDDLPINQIVDFRHIIFAGWLATKDPTQIPFKQVNQLCEHAIMQQHAIDMTLNKVVL